MTKMFKNGPRLMVGIALVSVLLSTCGSGADLPQSMGGVPGRVVLTEGSQGRVISLINAILGVEPSQKELINLAQLWRVTLTRDEKRVKRSLEKKFEQCASYILPRLETTEGRMVIFSVCQKSLRRSLWNAAPRRGQPQVGGAMLGEPQADAPQTEDPLTTIAYILNQR
ncbi:MAG: hypothetical protein LBR89_01080 [Holosporales bacterium]|nr:hypothetical protein [Holosporales bacterium]